MAKNKWHPDKINYYTKLYVSVSLFIYLFIFVAHFGLIQMLLAIFKPKSDSRKQKDPFACTNTFDYDLNVDSLIE